MNIGIYIYEQAEILDFSGPFEVFTTAERVSESNCFSTFLISEHKGLITARAGYQVMSHFDIDDHPTLDVLVVVGGVHHQQQENTKVLEWIAEQSQHVTLMASVCTGAFLLAQAGVLTNEHVTTHWQDIPDLKAQFPQLMVRENVRWVEERKVITSAGISAGIDMSLRIVERFYGTALADKTAKQMEFDRQ